MTDKKTIKFGDICREVRLTTKDPLGDGYERYIGLEHLDSGSLKIKRWGMIAEDSPSFTRVFKKGQILFGKRRPYLKKAAIAEFDGICSGDIIVMEPKGDDSLPELLPFIVQSEKFWDWAVQTSSGSLSPRTKFNALKDYNISIFLSKKRQVNLLGMLIKAQDVIDSSESSALSASQVEKVLSAKWFGVSGQKVSYTKLSLHAEHDGLQTGPFGSQLHASEYTEDGVPVLMPKELGFSSVNVSESARIPTEVANHLSRHTLLEGDFIFGRRGEIGRFGYITKELAGSICGTGCLRFRPKEKALVDFYKAFFKSASTVRWLNNNAVGMTMLNLNTAILGDLPVPVLDSAQCQQIASLFEIIDKQKETINLNLNKNRKLVSALING